MFGEKLKVVTAKYDQVKGINLALQVRGIVPFCLSAFRGGAHPQRLLSFCLLETVAEHFDRELSEHMSDVVVGIQEYIY